METKFGRQKFFFAVFLLEKCLVLLYNNKRGNADFCRIITLFVKGDRNGIDAACGNPHHVFYFSFCRLPFMTQYVLEGYFWESMKY